MQRFARYILVLTVLSGLSFAGVALAADPADTNPPKVVVKGADGETVVVSVDDGVLALTTTESGRTTTREVDLEAVGLLAADAVDDALGGVDEVFAGLKDLQFQCRLGRDNRLNLTCDDQEFELDLDQVMAQVASAVEFGLQEIDTSEWTRHGIRRDEASAAELRDELVDLKREMKELRRELRELRQDEGR